MPCLADSSHGASKILAFIFMRVSCCNSGTTASSFCNNRHAYAYRRREALERHLRRYESFYWLPSLPQPEVSGRFMSTAAPGSGEWLPEVVERYGVSTERSSKTATPKPRRATSYRMAGRVRRAPP